MHLAITTLEVSLQALEHNAPIYRAEGNHAQADLDERTAGEIRQALAVLRAATGGPITA